MLDYVVPAGIIVLALIYGKDIFNFFKSKFFSKNEEVTQPVDEPRLTLPAPAPAKQKVDSIGALHDVLESLDADRDAAKIRFLINKVGPSLLAPEDMKDFVDNEQKFN